MRYYEKENDDQARYFGKLHCPMIIISHLLLCVNYVLGAIVEAGKFWIDSFYILMAMFFILSSMLYGKWSYLWYQQFSQPRGYNALMEDGDEKLVEKL